jgi:excinuclease ABC subunit A
MIRSTHWECQACGASAPLAAARHFSPYTYAAACLKCNGVGSLQVPNPNKLIIHPDKPLVNGAMYSPGFFPNGYLGKPFNGGYYMVVALGERFGFDPQKTTWNEMTPEAQHAFLFGTEEKLKITYHSRTGRTSTYQQRFPGFYGFIRDWDVGGTYTDNRPCPECQGARLRPAYLAVSLGGYNIHQLSQMTLKELAGVMEACSQEHQPSVGQDALHSAHSSLFSTISRRLRFLAAVGLGYLHLDRVAGTLSAGEAQRIRLASLLGSGLTSLTLLLDEPTRGLHPSEVNALLEALESLRDEGNTVIVVEHDPLVMRSADHLIDCGPGAGPQGGRIVAQGTPAEVAQADTITARWLRGERRFKVRPRREVGASTPSRWLTIRGARANNLKGETVRLPLNALVGVCGVSGSGKSTLMMDTLGRVLAPKKQTTSVAYVPVDPGEYEALEGAPRRTLLVDQSRAGVHSPAAFLNLTPPLRALFAESEEAQALSISEQQLATRCSACGGSGLLTLDMAFLPDVHVPCETCRGTGYLPEAWEVRLRGLALPEVYDLTIDQVFALFGDVEQLARPLQAARDVGLGYLVLRQPGYSLSGGEAQRLRIAQELCRPPAGRGKSQGRSGQAAGPLADTLYILDEPSVGQHLEDVLRLTGVLHRLVDEGGSVFVVEHHPHLLAACDWLLELGPAGGPQGGYVIASGTPETVATGNTPSAPYLREVLGL